MKPLAGAGVAVLVFMLAGCGSTKVVTQTTTQTQRVVSVVPYAKCIQEAPLDKAASECGKPPTARIVIRHAPAQTVTVTVTHATAAVVSPAAGSSSGHTFSGTGIESVGTINVAQDSTLTWTCSGECSTFGIGNDPSDANHIELSSSGNSGKTAVVAGAYHQVQIITNGSWTIKISPG